MKRKTIYLFLIGLALASCSKKEAFEGVRVDERLYAQLAAYEAQLVGADHGWLGYLYPAGGGGYTFRFVFTAENRVTMYAAMNADYASSAKESSYRLRATQVPSLYFDTYSYLHELADPDPAIGGGPAGVGQQSDFEFAILSATTDTLRLKGNLNDSELVLVRAKEGQGDDYIRHAYAYNRQLDQLNRFPHYHNRFSIAGQHYNFTINTDMNTVSFYSGTDGFRGFHSAYAVKDNGIVLRTPFVDGDVVISELTDFEIDAEAHVATVNSAGTTATIVNEPDPLVVDKQAGRQMYIRPYNYTTNQGFTVNGQKDALGLGSIPGFIGAQYVPRRYVDGYDGFTIYFDQGAAAYTAVLNTRIEDDGRMIFHNYIGGQGLRPGGDHDATIGRTLGLLLEPQGYYVYQTGSTYFDLVSVADARVWIRFY